MSAPAALAMSSTKDELLNHLNLPSETYALMAKETDRVYIWLTSDKSHLKANCKRKPPFDWSDIQEKSKDEAMKAIATGGDQYTSYYWQLAGPTSDACPNWIARWFLYHKFRYRDGRNRTHVKGGEERKHHGESKSGRHHNSRGHQHSEYAAAQYSTRDGYYQDEESITAGNSYYPECSSYNVKSSHSYDASYTSPVADPQTAGSYYDPVRDTIQ